MVGYLILSYFITKKEIKPLVPCCPNFTLTVQAFPSLMFTRK